MEQVPPALAAGTRPGRLRRQRPRSGRDTLQGKEEPFPSCRVRSREEGAEPRGTPGAKAADETPATSATGQEWRCLRPRTPSGPLRLLLVRNHRRLATLIGHISRSSIPAGRAPQRGLRDTSRPAGRNVAAMPRAARRAGALEVRLAGSRETGGGATGSASATAGRQCARVAQVWWLPVEREQRGGCERPIAGPVPRIRSAPAPPPAQGHTDRPWNKRHGRKLPLAFVPWKA